MRRRELIAVGGSSVVAGCFGVTTDYDGCIGARKITGIVARRYPDEEPEDVEVVDDEALLENAMIADAVNRLQDGRGSTVDEFEQVSVSSSVERRLHEASCLIADAASNGGEVHIEVDDELIFIGTDAED